MNQSINAVCVQSVGGNLHHQNKSGTFQRDGFRGFSFEFWEHSRTASPHGPQYMLQLTSAIVSAKHHMLVCFCLFVFYEKCILLYSCNLHFYCRQQKIGCISSEFHFGTHSGCCIVQQLTLVHFTVCCTCINVCNSTVSIKCVSLALCNLNPYKLFMDNMQRGASDCAVCRVSCYTIQL